VTKSNKDMFPLFNEIVVGKRKQRRCLCFCATFTFPVVCLPEIFSGMESGFIAAETSGIDEIVLKQLHDTFICALV
jgi:non-canonical (house-cleaning) NTP pyrophosphatase